MPRAPRVCSQPGCPRQAAADGRCAQHKAPVWEKRTGIPGTSKTWRRKVLEQDDHTCRGCGAPATEADHIIPRSVAPHLANEPANGQALCKACHAKKTISDRTKAPSRAND